MANNINRININPQVVNYNHKKEGKEEQATAEKAAQGHVAKKEVPAQDVLGFMAAQSVDVKPAAQKRVLDVSKYVTPEQAERIAGFVQGFEAQVTEGLKAFDKEFPSASLSESDKLGLVAKLVEQQEL